MQTTSTTSAVFPDAPRRSPWGAIQTCTRVADGIYSVGTARHGGLKLDRKRNAMVPACVRAPGGWYEEDCAWCWVALALPNYFKPEDVAWAERIAKDTFPDEYTAMCGRTLTEADSRTLRDRALAAANHERYVVRAAWGDWAPGVPKGWVRVLARKASTGEERHYLVPADEYGNGARWFTIDEDRHPQTKP